MNEDNGLLFLALPQKYHRGKSFPIVIFLVFAPPPVFELGFILRLPGKMSENAIKITPIWTLIRIMAVRDPRTASTAKTSLEN